MNMQGRKDQELFDEMEKLRNHIQELEERGHELEEREEMYREIVHSANSIILCWNEDGNITFFNRFGLSYFGYNEDEVIGEKITHTIIPPESLKGLDLKTFMKNICEHPQQYANNENENIKKNGERVWISWSNKPMYDRQGIFVEILSVGNDITRRKHIEKELEEYASTDTMTGVLNRRAGLRFLEKTAELAKRHDLKLTIIFLDINNLKKVNDSFGHKEGDELIRISSEIIKNVLRKSDTLCRMGGDEFLAILPECSLQQAETVWRRALSKFEEFNKLRLKPFKISISHGTAKFDPQKHDLTSMEDFITEADKAMYLEKKRYKEINQEDTADH